MAYRQQAEIEERDPQLRYELVDGAYYPYAGPAGNVSLAAPCEQVDGEWYPFAEEGAPVVQGSLHGRTARDLENMTTGLLLDWPEVGIYSDVFLFWMRRQPRRYAPDLFVLPRVRKLKRERQSVYLWKEPSRCVFVLEVLSDSNEEEDPEERFRAYRDGAKINEYFLCDPRPTPPRVWGYRLQEGEYVPIPPDERGRIWSDQLKGWFGVNAQGQVQVWNEAGDEMPRYEDALQRLKEEARLRQAAEARVRELEEELRRLRGT